MARPMPSPVEALPWGSESSSSTRSPTAASAVDRLMAVVVLPTPPFWLAMARMRVALDTREALHLDDPPAGIADAARDIVRETPRFARLGDLGIDAFALQEERRCAFRDVRPRKPQQTHQRRDRAGGDGVGPEREILGARVVHLGRQRQRGDRSLQEAAALRLAFDEVDFRARRVLQQ